MDAQAPAGMEGYFGHKVFNTVYDVPCMYGIDADHPEAAGNIGQCGVHMSTGDDYDELVRDWPLESTNFSMITGDNSRTAEAIARRLRALEDAARPAVEVPAPQMSASDRARAGAAPTQQQPLPPARQRE